MSVRCLKFNIFYLGTLFCAVRTIWGSSGLRDWCSIPIAERNTPRSLSENFWTSSMWSSPFPRRGILLTTRSARAFSDNSSGRNRTGGLTVPGRSFIWPFLNTSRASTIHTDLMRLLAGWPRIRSRLTLAVNSFARSFSFPVHFFDYRPECHTVIPMHHRLFFKR